jgi:SAM-dependent methyltransferase
MKELLSAQGEHKIYQAWTRLGVEGQRPTERRFRIYGLDHIIGPDTAVLDLGCNVGFMSLKCAEKARIVHGVDRYAHWIDIAYQASKAVGTDNALFWCSQAEAFEKLMDYDLILSLSFHHWNEHGFRHRAKTLYRKFLAPGGHLLFESHKLNGREPFDEYSKILQDEHGFELVEQGRTQCPTTYPRPNPPRKWHLLKLSN